MASFLLYMFESAVCLSIFYLGYILLFRKETFFSFNRLYLLGSVILALVLPSLHYQINIGANPFVQKSALEVSKVKDYYKHVIMLTDPDYFPEQSSEELTQNTGYFSIFLSKSDVVKKIERGLKTIDFTLILLWTYIIGVCFFLLRFILLFYGIGKLISKSEVKQKGEIKLVLLNEEIPSFSFFNYVFIYVKHLSSDEFEQVWAHEKVHVQQRHSFDIVFVHGLLIFQWFNPLLWRVKKSLKTCHEYIADRQVVNQGYELFDYQSLILGQLISIRSVELVNNFNLLSIKKRIAMLNKINSKQCAKFKALVIIPLLVASFMFFADMKFPEATGNSSLIKVERQALKVNLPLADQVKEIQKDEVLFSLVVGEGKISDGTNTYTYSEIEKVIIRNGEKCKNKKCNQIILLEIDEAVLMSTVDEIKFELRKRNLLRIAYKVSSSLNKNSSNIYAIVNLLPPFDAKLVDEAEVEKSGMAIFKMDKFLNNTPASMAENLQHFIANNPKYLMLFAYDNATTYLEYIQHIDIIYKTIFDLRKNQAVKDGMAWDKLTQKEEKALKAKFPITLTMKNIDKD